MLLLAFDVDGTLWTSNGKVTEEMLVKLELAGSKVVIVSPSTARPKGWDEFIDGPARRDNLLKARERWPFSVRIYVSDNGDVEEAKAAGFLYVDREDFAEMMAA